MRTAPTVDDPPPLIDRFGLLLAVVAVTIAVMSLVDARASYATTALTQTLTGAALLVAVQTAGVPRRWRRRALVLVLASLLVTGTTAVLAALGYIEKGTQAGGPQVLWVVAALLVPAAVARRLLRHDVVSLSTLLGAVAAYLEIAVGFAIALQSLDAVTASPIYGQTVPTTSYIYASLVTITTTGFGDLVPVTPPARLLTTTEAVLGQVFLVTFVAMIVSRFPLFGASGGGSDGDHA